MTVDDQFYRAAKVVADMFPEDMSNDSKSGGIGWKSESSDKIETLRKEIKKYEEKKL